MLNGWLVYQNLACRIWARSAFYQSGGAFGYRRSAAGCRRARGHPPRPDAANSSCCTPRTSSRRATCCTGGIPEPLERGLRTRFSDDLLWLPLITAHYLRVTGDAAILDERGAVSSRADLAGARSRTRRTCSRETERRIRRPLRTLSARPRPLADQRCSRPAADGHGRLERRHEPRRAGRARRERLARVSSCITSSATSCRCASRRDDQARLAHYRDYRTDLADALETSGWDGAWYRRAYYDDGTPLGSAPGCRSAASTPWPSPGRSSPAPRRASGRSRPWTRWRSI